MSSYHHGDVRRAAIDAVTGAVRTGGAERVTIRAIAAEVGVSHAALYRHVASVEQLFDAAAAEWLDTVVGGGRHGQLIEREHPGHAGHGEPVASFLARYVEAALADRALYRLAFVRAADRDGAPLTAAAIARLRDHAGAVFAAGWPDDTARATMHRVIRTWSTVHGMLDLADLGLVVTSGAGALPTYVVNSAMRSAHAAAWPPP